MFEKVVGFQVKCDQTGFTVVGILYYVYILDILHTTRNIRQNIVKTFTKTIKSAQSESVRFYILRPSVHTFF
jgi:hypothetical protein